MLVFERKGWRGKVTKGKGASCLSRLKIALIDSSLLFPLMLRMNFTSPLAVHLNTRTQCNSLVTFLLTVTNQRPWEIYRRRPTFNSFWKRPWVIWLAVPFFSWIINEEFRLVISVFLWENLNYFYHKYGIISIFIHADIQSPMVAIFFDILGFFLRLFISNWWNEITPSTRENHYIWDLLIGY